MNMFQSLPTDAIVLGLTFVGFIFVFLLLKEILQKRDLAKRVQNISYSNQANTAQAAFTQKPTKGNALRDKVKIFKKSTDKYVKNFKSDNVEEMRTLFEQAGLNPINAQIIGILSKLSLTLIFFIVAVFCVSKVPSFVTLSGTYKLGVVIIFALAGYVSFDFFMKFKIRMRYERIRSNLANALDLLVVCTNSGLSIDKSFEQVALEVGNNSPDLGKEFAITSIELGILPQRSAAFKNLARRVDLPLVRGLVTTLTQAEEQGSSVSQTLKILAKEFNNKMILEAEAKAARLPAVLSIPVVVLILPSLLIILMAPAILSINETYRFF